MWSESACDVHATHWIRASGGRAAEGLKEFREDPSGVMVVVDDEAPRGFLECDHLVTSSAYGLTTHRDLRLARSGLQRSLYQRPGLSRRRKEARVVSLPLVNDELHDREGIGSFRRKLRLVINALQDGYIHAVEVVIGLLARCLHVDKPLLSFAVKRPQLEGAL